MIEWITSTFFQPRYCRYSFSIPPEITVCTFSEATVRQSASADGRASTISLLSTGFPSLPIDTINSSRARSNLGAIFFPSSTRSTFFIYVEPNWKQSRNVSSYAIECSVPNPIIGQPCFDAHLPSQAHPESSCALPPTSQGALRS